MEEMKKSALQLPRGTQRPIKTEWNSRCVVFTYFQGDINSVVDEHFSRALSNMQRPQELSPSSHIEDAVLKNDSGMPPNEWRFSSQWTKSRPEMSLANSASNSSSNVSGPPVVDRYSLSLPATSSAESELWHLSSLAGPSSSEHGYSQVFPSGHLVPELQPAGKCDSLFSLLQQDRCLNCPRESATREDCNPDRIVGGKKGSASPSHRPASPSLENEGPKRQQHCCA
ncbi:transcription cofactor vestigial-like protein 1 [Ctenodactylus gundi]